MRVKICGITRPEQGKSIADSGATSLGFICVRSSPRYVSTGQIQGIKSVLPAATDCIGVFAGSTIATIKSVVGESGIDGVQLHGDETPHFCRQLREELPKIEIIKALRIKDLELLSQCQYYYDCVDTLLLDAYHPQILGGTGKVIDWRILTRFSPPIPWLLAGGLTPDNIKDALAIINPDGIDLSSGVETAPGDKDLKKVARLFEQLRILVN
ncbi:MAG: N-(5'-phosphoribosyl)anthranilate isomerase [Chroococcopsis gigantea SAG 12.99]|jgi:phosphoribosylanthranilate isomerase|nr:N-(5'-phosphoribosyl)anthranilate isomerase [Chroococcopsis gigantea SAG 12.99]